MSRGRGIPNKEKINPDVEAWITPEGKVPQLTPQERTILHDLMSFSAYHKELTIAQFMYVFGFPLDEIEEKTGFNTLEIQKLATDNNWQIDDEKNKKRLWAEECEHQVRHPEERIEQNKVLVKLQEEQEIQCNTVENENIKKSLKQFLSDSTDKPFLFIDPTKFQYGVKSVAAKSIIMEMIKKGRPLRVAFASLGFSKKQQTLWLDQDESFQEAIFLAGTQYERNLISVIEDATRVDWKAATYLLEHHPDIKERYKQEVEKTGVQINLNFQRGDEMAHGGIVIDQPRTGVKRIDGN